MCYNVKEMWDNLNQVNKRFEEKAKQIGGCNAWIFKAKKDQDSKILAKLDVTVGNMQHSERAKFKKRFTCIIPDNATSYIREYDDQFLEALVEILGWGWLKDRYPPYTPQFTLGTPDLLVKDNSGQMVAAMECKKIRSSDEDRDYYKSHQGEARPVRNSLTSDDYAKNPFLRKLVDTLCKAKEQVSQSGAPDKFIFLDLTFDTLLMFPVLKGPMICAILRIASELCKNGIYLVSLEQFQVEEANLGYHLPTVGTCSDIACPEGLTNLLKEYF